MNTGRAEIPPHFGRRSQNTTLPMNYSPLVRAQGKQSIAGWHRCASDPAERGSCVAESGCIVLVLGLDNPDIRYGLHHGPRRSSRAGEARSSDGGFAAESSVLRDLRWCLLKECRPSPRKAGVVHAHGCVLPTCAECWRHVHYCRAEVCRAQSMTDEQAEEWAGDVCIPALLTCPHHQSGGRPTTFFRERSGQESQ